MTPNTDTRSLGLTEKERAEYSILRAIRSRLDPYDPNCLEAEISDAYVETHGTPHGYRGGIIVPLHDLRPEGIEEQRDVTVGGSAANLVEQKLLAKDFISLLRNQTRVRQLGATVLTGLTGNVKIPRQTGAAAIAWLAENAAPTESDQTFDQVTLTPKTVSANTKFSRQSILQATPEIEELVRRDLTKVVAIEVDRAAINGSGASNQPTGILQTTGVGSIVFSADAGNGAAASWGDVMGFIAALEQANIVDDGTEAFLTTPSARAKLATTTKAGTFPEFILTPETNGRGMMAGFPTAFSNNVPSNLTKGSGTGLSALLFGRWSDVIIGEWGTLEILVDPYTYSTSGSVQITIFYSCDIAIRHPVAFAANVAFNTA